MPREPIRYMEALSAKMAEADELKKELHLSLMLQDFCPKAFSHGSCSVGGRGNMRHKPKEAIISIRLGNGEVLEYPALEVPFVLWPGRMQEDFLTIPKGLRPAVIE